MANDRKDLRGSGAHVPGGSEYAGVGLQFAAAILIFFFLGKWLDERLGTSPWLLMLGVLLGFGLGFLWMYRRLVVEPRSRKPGDGKGPR